MELTCGFPVPAMVVGGEWEVTACRLATIVTANIKAEEFQKFKWLTFRTCFFFLSFNSSCNSEMKGF